MTTVAIPETLDAVLTPQWLNTSLGTRFAGIEIASVTPGPVVSRVSTNARFTIKSDGALPAGLSPHLCVKGYFGEYTLARPAGIPETVFYRDLVDSIGVRTLRAVYADVDTNTGHNVVITEDVVAQGARFLDATSDYSADQVAASLEQLAVLHAATWCRPDRPDQQWLASRLSRTLAARGEPEIRRNFDGPNGAGVPDAVRDPALLIAAYHRLADLSAHADPWCIVHGDAHIGNVFLDPAGAPAFLDWQLVQRGPWWIDVGYHIASALPVAERRRRERDLVDHYLDRLRAAGVDAPSPDDAWLGFRRGIVHGFFLWAITLKVVPTLIAEMLTRLGAAAADHDSLAALA
jgi:hypothetical protein